MINLLTKVCMNESYNYTSHIGLLDHFITCDLALCDIERSNNQGHCVFIGLNIITIYYYTAELSGHKISFLY